MAAEAGTPLPPGLPDGVIELAAEHWRQAETRSDRAGIAPPTLNDEQLSRRLREELTAPIRLEDWPAPTAPHPVAEGWVHIEVIDEDRAALDALLGRRDLRDGADPLGAETVAALAQEMRLPVSPYRRFGTPTATQADSGNARIDDPIPGADRSRPPVVIDLTTHWAGPLATKLLLDAGADVTKIDPSCRPDGFRARPRLYDHLNAGKEVLDLDLRQPRDRERFEARLAEADLLVESFSRRVLPNLGYDQARLFGLNPRLGVLSIKAFPAASPEADWLAFGPGVHAASGLGLRTAVPQPAPIAYPDLVAGVNAFARATDLVARCRRGVVPDRAVEISLARSIAPLVNRAVADKLVEPV